MPPSPFKKTLRKKSPVAKLDLSDVGQPAASRESEHPAVPDSSGTLGRQALALREARDKIKGLKDQAESIAGFISQQAVPFIIEQNYGRTAPLTGVAIEVEEPVSGIPGASRRSTAALVILNDKYPLVTDDRKKKVDSAKVQEAVEKIVGKKFFAEHFREVAVVSVDLDRVAENRRQDMIDELRSLFQRFSAKDAVTVEHGFKGRETLHVARCTQLTAAQSMELQSVYPASVTVKTDKIK